MKIDDEMIDFIFSSESFKMFKNNIKVIVSEMDIKEYDDCEQIAEPSSRNEVYIVITGGIAIVDDDRTLKRVRYEVKKLRRKRKKELEKRKQEGAEEPPS